jgi:nicotinamidase-related amidase
MSLLTGIASRHQSQLVMVDMQEKLIPAMPVDVADVISHCAILLQAANLLEIPVVHTEQYPKGLGHTISALSPYLNSKLAVEKLAFSCCAEPTFNRRLYGDKSQVILMGMESHICILQTALDLLKAGKQVLVVEDAVISRNPSNKQNALNRLRQAGVLIVNAESVVFEWLGVAEGDAFKTISKLIR